MTGKQSFFMLDSPFTISDISFPKVSHMGLSV